MDSPDDLRKTALALLNSEARISRKAGSFLGQIVADPLPLTEAQAEWLAQLVSRAERPSGERGRK